MNSTNRQFETLKKLTNRIGDYKIRSRRVGDETRNNNELFRAFILALTPKCVHMYIQEQRLPRIWPCVYLTEGFITRIPNIPST